MDRIVIKGVPGFDGEYPFDLNEQWFNNAELHIIKRIAAVRVGELSEALEAGDNDLLVAMAVCAVRRTGKYMKSQLAQFEDVLWEADGGAIDFVVEADDAVPPTSPPTSEPTSNSDSGENMTSSGETSASDSESLENGRSRTGLQPSELSAT